MKHSQPIAFPTLAPGSTVIGIPLVIGMTGRTMCLDGITGGHASTSEKVRPNGDRLQMSGVHTSAVAAQVINLETIRDRSLVEFVGHAVNAEIVLSTLAGGHDSVALAESTGPRPAFIGATFVHAVPESHLSRHNQAIGVWHD